MPIIPDNGFDIIRTIVWSAAGMILAYVGVATAENIANLTGEIGGLRIAIVKLEARVDRLPPNELLLRLELLEINSAEFKAHMKQEAHD